MADLTPPLPSEDIAWVRIATPLLADDLREFCQDIQRLLRINPMLEFIEWRQLSPNHYYLQAKNLSNDKTIATELNCEETKDGFKINYSEGIKSASFIRIEKNAKSKGSSLVIIDDYSSRFSESERKQRLAEVDSSLEIWGKYLYSYLKNWQRWHWFPPYRWYMRRIWQPMKPSARRIAYMLIVISFFELLAFLVFVGVMILN
jgi:hypothetical protein